MRNELKISLFIPIINLILFAGCTPKAGTDQMIYCVPLLVGEVSQTSAIFQSRLAESDSLVYENIHDAASIAKTDLKGVEGIAFFEVSQSPSFTESTRSSWMNAEKQNDYIIKEKMDSLQPGTKYYYRLHYGTKRENLFVSPVHSFKTLPSIDIPSAIEFVMITGSNLDGFYLGAGFGKPTTEGAEAYKGEDKYSGFPGLKTIAEMKPDFFIGNGDNVYYDLPPDRKARTQQELRAKWHRAFGMHNMMRLFSQVPTYWLKDDHDHRFNDSDTLRVNEKHGDLPSHELGVKTFIEQVPVIDRAATDTRTYRSYQVGSLLQIWFLEGRDYRTANKTPDGPAKTIWGDEQKRWLKQTLLESRAMFKLLISPTPMVGPDDAKKRDNHVNASGFRYEGESFFAWLKENNFLAKNFYILCGDRHWQYHSIHPSGFEEFSSGAIVDQNARLGRIPGDSLSSDPDALIRQPFSQKEASGGFLKVIIRQGADKVTGEIEFVFYDENGVELYRTLKGSANENKSLVTTGQ